MKIGIDCRTILHPETGEDRGIGHYTDQLVRHLIRPDARKELLGGGKRFVLFFDSRAAKAAGAHFNKEYVSVRKFPFIQYKALMPVAYSHFLATAMISHEDLDIFHAPVPHIPLSYRGPAVVTVHDLAIYKRPDLFPPGQFFSTQVVVPRTLKLARRIISVSEATRADLIDLFSIPEEKIKVIPNGLDPFFRERPSQEEQEAILGSYGITSPFLFSLGTLEPRKNFVNLIRAFELAADKLEEMILVIAGREGYRSKDVHKAIARSKFRERIRWIGYVQPHLERSLLSKCHVFIYPSLHEGFGTPVLTALSQGANVITTKRDGVREITGDAGWYLEDPTNPDEMAECIINVSSAADAERGRRSRDGIQKAREYSWDTTARNTQQVYADAM